MTEVQGNIAAHSYTNSCVIIKAKPINNCKTTSVLCFFLCLGADYGLTAYRKGDFEAVSNGFNCGDVNRVYCSPEVLLGSSSNMTQAADMYRYLKVEYVVIYYLSKSNMYSNFCLDALLLSLNLIIHTTGKKAQNYIFSLLFSSATP